MKSFDDFLSTLSPEDQSKILSKAMAELKQTGGTFSERELKVAVFAAQVTALSCREMLRHYHDWLIEQI